MKSWIAITLSILTGYVIFSKTCYANHQDPLPSWNNSPIKQHIIQFVEGVSNKTSRSYVDLADRIATIDNDGTLWVEQPLYTQGRYTLDRFKSLAPKHPEWKTQEPFKSILENKPVLGKLTLEDYKKILAATLSDLTVDELHKNVSNWLKTSKDPRFHRHFTQLIYKPMLELICYLKANDFKVYITTGGGQEFVRSFAYETYGISADYVIGSAVKTEYSIKNNKPVLNIVPSILFISDTKGKPEAINLVIGKRPIFAVGNSDGDRQMLEWTQSNPKPHLMALVHHDDATREYAYGAKSKIGTFSDSLRLEAQKSNWNIISMKNDWKAIFPG